MGEKSSKAGRTEVFLVTGASSGIGRATARILAARGAVVYGTTRQDPDTVELERSRERPRPTNVHLLRMDVDDPRSVDDGVQQILSEQGRIDGVVNCAGFGIAGAVEDTSDQEARAIFETNLLGILRVCRAVLPAMRRQRHGTIVNLSSIAGRIAVPFQGLYSATKFAVEGLTEAIALEVRPFGIRVVLVEPGDFHTAFTDRRRRTDASARGPYYDRFAEALGVSETDERSGSGPEPIARLIGRILSSSRPRARYVIGPPAQRIALRLKSILPARVFQWGLSAYYHIR